MRDCLGNFGAAGRLAVDAAQRQVESVKSLGAA